MKIKNRESTSIEDISLKFITKFGPFTLMPCLIGPPEEGPFVLWELIHPDLGIYTETCPHTLIEHCYNLLRDHYS
jgi:hypothetical protein